MGVDKRKSKTMKISRKLGIIVLKLPKFQTKQKKTMMPKKR
jgi:hypothetical protein